MKLDLVGENWMEKIGCSVCPFDFIKWHDRKDFMLYNFLIKFEEHCRETINTMTANGPITGLWFSLYIVVSSIFTFTYIKKIKHFVSEFRSVREAYSRALSSLYNTSLLSTTASSLHSLTPPLMTRPVSLLHLQSIFSNKA